ncbi:NAD(P)/FAD-dependent oxidoreductase [Streptomyces sp. NPDC055607]
MTRVVIVGAGMVGLATAWHLIEDGAEAVVLDRTGVAAGSSRGNAGWLAPALTLPLPDPAILGTGVLAMLSSRSPVYVPPTLNPRLLRFLAGFAWHCRRRPWERAMKVYGRLNAEALTAFDEIELGGMDEGTRSADPFVAAFRNRADAEPLEAELRHAARHGADVDFGLLQESELRTMVPSLGRRSRVGLVLRHQRFIRPGAYVEALADAVAARGGVIRRGADVTGVAAEHGRVRVVSADGSEITADHVVLANGAWLGGLAREWGVKAVVQAGRGYSFSVRPDVGLSHPVYFPTQRVACTPLGDGRLRVAGMMEFKDPDAPLDQRRISAIVQAARPMLGRVDWTDREDEWVGSRPCTADGLPLVGRTRDERVHVAGGHGMWGIALGPLTGRILARTITRGERHEVLDALDPLR